MSYHVSVDVGGTFTDLFAVDAEAGSVIVQKTDTSEDAVGGVLAVLEQGGIPLERIEGFVVGTTLAINALVEGRTAVVAFLGTRGFTDNLEIRRTWRAHLFGWRWERPRPLVTHALRFGVGGRIDWQGKEFEPLVRDDVDTAVAEMRRQGVTTAAVSLLFSFINPAHERRVMARIAELAPEIRVVLSSDVNPEIKEYERASTTVIAAAITPFGRAPARGSRSTAQRIGRPRPFASRQVQWRRRVIRFGAYEAVGDTPQRACGGCRLGPQVIESP